LDTNLFCIPALSSQEPPVLANYNSKLALRYRDRVASYIKDGDFRTKLLDGPGPFLISSTQPLARIKVRSPILFFDLSGMSDQDMSDVVSFYKQHIREKGLSEFDIEDHIRLEVIRFNGFSKKINWGQVIGVIIAVGPYLVE
jgi:hypothetical protein